MACEGSFGGGLGGTLGALAAYGGDFGVTLALFWGQFGFSLGLVWVSVGDFGSFDGHFTIIVESLWVYESPFSKNTYFPH